MEIDNLIQLFHASHGIDRQRLRALHTEDRDRLRRMVLGEVQTSSRGRALEAWAELALPDVAQVLEYVLTDQATPSETRAAAATHLGRLGVHDVEVPLAQHMTTEASPLVRIKILGALARIGTTATLDAIYSLATSNEAAVARQARFAARVIACRHRMDVAVDPEPARRLGPVAGMRAFPMTPASSATVTSVLASMRETFGLTASHESALEFTCGTRSHVFLVDDRYRGVPAELARRPALVGIIAGKAAVDGSYSVSRVILTHPQKDQSVVDIEVYRTDGVLTQVGQAQPVGDHLNIEIAAVEHPGNAAVDVQLELRDRQLRALKATGALQPGERQAPARFTRPEPEPRKD